MLEWREYPILEGVMRAVYNGFSIVCDPSRMYMNYTYEVMDLDNEYITHTNDEGVMHKLIGLN